MVYPKDRIEDYRERRNRLSGNLFFLSLGAYFNLIPFIDFMDVSTVTHLQWVFLAIDTAILIVSVLVYICYSFRISRVRKTVGSRKLGS